jgi:cyclophilin family peptidyl-prolyl cis-trans isomerase
MPDRRIRFATSLGDLVIETMEEKSPLTVTNFVEYVTSGFYDGTIFHRIIPGFVVQGGGMNPGMDQKKTRAPVKNEASGGPKNLRGTLSMARTNDPHSATSQFFINLVNNASLDAGGPSGAGYCVFGKVVEGLEVIDAMAKVKTTRKGPHSDVPAEDVVLVKASLEV